MALPEKIKSDMEQALRKGEKLRLSTLRLIVSAMNYYEIEKQKKIDDAGVIEVLSREAKKRKESIEAFEKGNRQDLADQEKTELAIISEYMPQQMSQDEITAAAQKIIAQVGAKSPADKGKVMQQLVPVTKGKADGKAVSDTVNDLLSKL
ncbi:MAG: aspartyl-tRNA amidotransferase [Chloroflexi bacterium RBG_16_48_7]|nr:MAG: aspartyl-tRNA amidotransferase [Chloroflexi bacterium RBG_16_48_7]